MHFRPALSELVVTQTLNEASGDRDAQCRRGQCWEIRSSSQARFQIRYAELGETLERILA